jgi:transposase-like protein
MKATRRKFSAGFKAQVAIEALKERGNPCRVSQAF